MIDGRRLLLTAAEAEARPGFDLCRFHDAVLANGSTPLQVLEHLMQT